MRAWAHSRQRGDRRIGADVTAAHSNPPIEEAQELIAKLRRAFAATLPSLLDTLGEACASARADDPASLEQPKQLAHRLAGSGGTFGMDGLTRAARHLEGLLAQPRSGATWQCSMLDAFALILEAQHSPSELVEISRPKISRPATSAPRNTDPPTSSRYPQPHGRWAAVPIVVVIDDVATRQSILNTLQQFGFLVVGCDSPTRFPITPLAFVCTLNHAEAIRNLYPKADIITVLDYANLEARLAAVRVGCRATVSMEADAPEIAAAMERLFPLELEVPRVLVVDDDHFVSRATAAVLERSGLVVTVLNDPQALLEVTADVRPHLVLMDMRLPHCNGLELAAVLRHDDRMVGVPIVFLTAVDEPAQARLALEIGADDFLVKPVEPATLVAVVSSRLNRSRALRSYMDRDSLTRLFSHARTIERIELEVDVAHRRGEPLALAILDLDHFKRVNDEYGHATGDRVLRSLSTVLRRRARQGDIIGRCGGEEFAVILPATRGAEAQQLLNERRQTFSSLRYGTVKGPFTVSFSAGIAELLENETPASLWDRADRALYAAKESGRNRVICSDAGSCPQLGDE